MSFNKSLMGLRGFAAMAVLIFHVWSGALKDNFMPDAVPDVLRVGLLSLQFGVELFFMISGYLITGSIIRHNDVRRFLIDRILKIYPAFLPVLLLIFVLGFVRGYSYFDGVVGIEWAGLFIANLLFVPGVYPMPPALLVAWTLSYEAVFYVFCSLIFVFSKILPRAVVVVVTSLLTIAAIYLYPRAAFFTIGVGIYFLQPYLNEFGKATQSGTWIALIASFASLLLCEQNINSEFSRPIISAALCITATISGALVFISVITQIGLFCSFLRLPVLQWLGAISYSLYLWHTPVMFVTKRLSLKLFSGFGDWAIITSFAASSLLVSIPISWISYLVFEKWLPKKLNPTSVRRPTLQSVIAAYIRRPIH